MSYWTIEQWNKFRNTKREIDLEAVYESWYPRDSQEYDYDSDDEQARRYLESVTVIYPIISRQAAAVALAMAEYIGKKKP